MAAINSFGKSQTFIVFHLMANYEWNASICMQIYGREHSSRCECEKVQEMLEAETLL